MFVVVELIHGKCLLTRSPPSFPTPQIMFCVTFKPIPICIIRTPVGIHTHINFHTLSIKMYEKVH